jgi:hypothetical protein
MDSYICTETDRYILETDRHKQETSTVDIDQWEIDITQR